MTTTVETQTLAAPTDETKTIEPLERLFAAAQPGAVFSEPVTTGAYTVITAREVTLGGGFGFGGGYGPAPQVTEGGSQQAIAGGRGGAGGGGSSGRPVAAIIIGPEGVKVQPIVDVTKFMLAAFGAVGVVATLIGRLAKARKS